jgi:UDP-glucose-4-epimerase GalE
MAHPVKHWDNYRNFVLRYFMRLLVTGGAGYIGSHVCKLASEAGNEVVVYDNLSRGWQSFLKFGDFVRGDIIDTSHLESIMRDRGIEAVIHCAALAYVRESESLPQKYWQTNVDGTKSVCEAMVSTGVKSIVFSSSCSIYGNPRTVPVHEELAPSPLSVYAKTKLRGEEVIQGCDSIRSFSLRFFNAAGAAYLSGIGEKHEPETHIIPILINRALGITEHDIPVFRIGVQTEDGYPMRDFVHVMDIAQAHLNAIEVLNAQSTGYHQSLNIGSGYPTSLLRLIELISAKTNFDLRKVLHFENKADYEPDMVYAALSAARQIINWAPERNLNSIIDDSISWIRYSTSN